MNLYMARTSIQNPGPICVHLGTVSHEEKRTRKANIRGWEITERRERAKVIKENVMLIALLVLILSFLFFDLVVDKCTKHTRYWAGKFNTKFYSFPFKCSPRPLFCKDMCSLWWTRLQRLQKLSVVTIVPVRHILPGIWVLYPSVFTAGKAHRWIFSYQAA